MLKHIVINRHTENIMEAGALVLCLCWCKTVHKELIKGGGGEGVHPQQLLVPQVDVYLQVNLLSILTHYNDGSFGMMNSK
jgi:hypothetical protein